MNILFLGRFLLWDKKAYGGDIHIHKLAENLAKLGCKVDYINASNFQGIRKGINFVKAKYRCFRGAPYYPLVSPNKMLKYDVIHGFSTQGYPLNWIANLEKRPLLVQTQLSSRMAPLGIKRPVEFLFKFKPFRYIAWRLEKIACNAADIVVTTSTAMKDQILKEYNVPKEKILVIPRGVNIKKFIPTPYPEKSKIILTVSRLEIEKGIHHLIEVTKKLRNNIEIELLIVGEGKDENYLKRLAKGCDFIKFLGRISHNDISHLYSKCNLFVLTSKFEPFGAVLLEAMASARPVVATKSGGPSDIITEECGKLVEYGNVNMLSETILELLTNFSKAKEMGLNARMRVEKYFTWEAEAKKYLEIYDTMLSRR